MQIRPQAPHTLHVQVCLENTSQRERDVPYVIETETSVTSRFRDSDAPWPGLSGPAFARYASYGGLESTEARSA